MSVPISLPISSVLGSLNGVSGVSQVITRVFTATWVRRKHAMHITVQGCNSAIVGSP